MWTYKNKPFTSDDIQDYIGFVYIITDPDGMKYVGKKVFINKRKLPPLKGKKRKRIKIVESDWQDYYGSSDKVNELVEQLGRDKFHREILHLCSYKAEMSYLEMLEQVEREVLFKPDEYHNGIIQVRISSSHFPKDVLCGTIPPPTTKKP
jgi:hypothetical protein